MNIVNNILKAEHFDGHSICSFFISKPEVENNNRNRMKAQLQELRKAGSKGKNSLVLCFLGYDDDPREVYQISEIRIYLRNVFKEYPEIFYFANIDSYTFAIMVNAIFEKQEEVTMADEAILAFAKKVEDKENVTTVTTYIKQTKSGT